MIAIFQCAGDPVVAELENPLDPDNGNYIEPGFTAINGLNPGSVLNNNTLSINWEGTSPDLLYWVSLTGSEMTAGGEAVWVFFDRETSLDVDYLNEGQHTLRLKTQYTIDHSDTFVDSINFAIDALAPNSLWLYPTRIFADSNETFQVSLRTDEWSEEFISGSVGFEFSPNLVELVGVSEGGLVPTGSFFHEHNDDYLSSGLLQIDFATLSDPPVVVSGSGAVLAFEFRLLSDVHGDEIITLSDNSELRNSENLSIPITNHGDGGIYSIKISPR